MDSISLTSKVWEKDSHVLLDQQFGRKKKYLKLKLAFDSIKKKIYLMTSPHGLIRSNIHMVLSTGWDGRTNTELRYLNIKLENNYISNNIILIDIDFMVTLIYMPFALVVHGSNNNFMFMSL